MKRFRCYNCQDVEGMPGHDFYGEAPVCDKCGLDGTKPQYARFFAVCKAIHFNPPDPAFAKGHIVHGLGHPACGVKFIRGVMLTNAPKAVNCEACKATEEWIAAIASESFNPEDDFPVNIDTAKMMITKG